MKKIILSLLLSLTIISSRAQVTDPLSGNTEQRLEILTEKNAGTETEDDGWLQQMQHFLKHPLNLNTTDMAGLESLQILNQLQIQAFMDYRKLFGKFINIYELQAIPGWSENLLDKIRPFITVSMEEKSFSSLKKQFFTGDDILLLRASWVPEKSKGYFKPDSNQTNFYPGSRQQIFLRYSHRYRNNLQYGILAEKDPGEQWFKGGQRRGFDFYSAHIFIKNLGIIRSLALGDFTVNMGQGLIQWQSLGFQKTSDALQIKRNSPVFLPYHSSGESNFHRGLGISLGIRQWQTGLFLSYKKIDANLVPDSLSSSDYVSSFQTSGLHRTAAELSDRGIQRQFAVGAFVSRSFGKWHIGFNGIRFQFKLPIQKTPDPYNKYAFSGNALQNFSMDYSYTHKNFHVFGEAAVSGQMHKALLTGMLISLSARTDLALLYRHIDPQYQSWQASAFTENSTPVNETGCYTGIQIRPAPAWRIDAFADIYRFPWLKYRVNSASSGADYFLEINCKPNKQCEFYSRYSSGHKALNMNDANDVLSPVIQQYKHNWRLQFGYQFNPAISFRSRTEIVWFHPQNQPPEQGFMENADVLFHPPLKRFSGGLRLQYFESEGYNSRIYAYENDVLYSFSIPVFDGKGFRYYINFNYEINKKLNAQFRWSQTIYSDRSLIGTGFEEISGNHRSALKCQLICRF